ncbi:hypothetical protein ACFL3A_13365 [Pseudomonadota bacterium]
MGLHLWDSVNAYLLALVTTLPSVSAGQPLEGRLPAIPGGTDTVYAASLTIGDISAVPIAVWVVVFALIGLVEIARRNSAGR